MLLEELAVQLGLKIKVKGMRVSRTALVRNRADAKTGLCAPAFIVLRCHHRPAACHTPLWRPWRHPERPCWPRLRVGRGAFAASTAGNTNKDRRGTVVRMPAAAAAAAASSLVSLPPGSCSWQGPSARGPAHQCRWEEVREGDAGGGAHEGQQGLRGTRDCGQGKLGVRMGCSCGSGRASTLRPRLLPPLAGSRPAAPTPCSLDRRCARPPPSRLT